MTVLSGTEVITTLTVGPRPARIGINVESGLVYVPNTNEDVPAGRDAGCNAVA